MIGNRIAGRVAAFIERHHHDEHKMAMEGIVYKAALDEQWWRNGLPRVGRFLSPVECYRELWDSINAKRAPWAENPWVWAVTFKRIADA